MGPMNAATLMFSSNNLHSHKFLRGKNHTRKTIFETPSRLNRVFRSHSCTNRHCSEPIFRNDLYTSRLSEPNSIVSFNLLYGETGIHKVNFPEREETTSNIESQQDCYLEKTQEINEMADVKMIFIPLVKISVANFQSLNLTRDNIRDKFNVTVPIDDCKVFKELSPSIYKPLHLFDLNYSKYSSRSILKYKISEKIKSYVSYKKLKTGYNILGIYMPIIKSDNVYNKTWEEYEGIRVPTRLILNNIKLNIAIDDEKNYTEIIFKSIICSQKRGITNYDSKNYKTKCKVGYIIWDRNINKSKKSDLPTLILV